jgi:hypothetical protein
LENIDHKIAEVKRKIADVKKRWPFHSPKPSMFQELETLEMELEDLKRKKITLTD